MSRCIKNLAFKNLFDAMSKINIVGTVEQNI